MYAFPRSGDMTERIIIEHKLEGGGYTLFGAPMAELMPVTGKEVMVADGIKPVRTVRFRTRYSQSLAGMDTRLIRIINKGAVYNVTYIEDDKNQHVQLFIVAERVT